MSQIAISTSTAGLQAELARIQQDARSLGASLPEPAGAAAPQGFADSLAQALRGVDAREQDANARMEAVDSGQSDDLVGAMLASQQASLSFSMLMQVRNKVAGAIDELVKLPL